MGGLGDMFGGECFKGHALLGMVDGRCPWGQVSGGVALPVAAAEVAAEQLEAVVGVEDELELARAVELDEALELDGVDDEVAGPAGPEDSVEDGGVRMKPVTTGSPVATV